MLRKSSSVRDDIRQEQGGILVCEENLESAKQEVVQFKNTTGGSPGSPATELLPTSTGDTVLALA